MSTTFTCQDEFGPHTEHRDCQWILAQMSWGYDDDIYVTAADGTIQVVPREPAEVDRDDDDDSHYLPGSGERDDDPSYIQYLNNH